jgi:hypothetical protein
MNDTTKIHHINFDYNPTGLTPTECDRLVGRVRDGLVAKFGVDPYNGIRIRADAKFIDPPYDVRVMRGAGSTPDYVRIFDAFRVVTKIWFDVQYRPAIVRDLPAPVGAQAVVVRVAKPLESAGVSNG